MTQYASLHGVDYAALFLRLALGVAMLMHGWNHAWGGGKLPGTTRWFRSIGFEPAEMHALMATVTELGAGALLILGLFTPLAAAGVLGVMVVALISNHLKNGFFIFRPGEGYEYVLFIIWTAFGLAALGAGKYSIDYHIVSHFHGWLYGGKGLLVSLLGVVGAAVLLVTSWTPPAKEESS